MGSNCSSRDESSGSIRFRFRCEGRPEIFFFCLCRSPASGPGRDGGQGAGRRHAPHASRLVRGSRARPTPSSSQLSASELTRPAARSQAPLLNLPTPPLGLRRAHSAPSPIEIADPRPPGSHARRSPSSSSPQARCGAALSAGFQSRPQRPQLRAERSLRRRVPHRAHHGAPLSAPRQPLPRTRHSETASAHVHFLLRVPASHPLCTPARLHNVGTQRTGRFRPLNLAQRCTSKQFAAYDVCPPSSTADRPASRRASVAHQPATHLPRSVTRAPHIGACPFPMQRSPTAA